MSRWTSKMAQFMSAEMCFFSDIYREYSWTRNRIERQIWDNYSIWCGSLLILLNSSLLMQLGKQKFIWKVLELKWVHQWNINFKFIYLYLQEFSELMRTIFPPVKTLNGKRSLDLRNFLMGVFSAHTFKSILSLAVRFKIEVFDNVIYENVNFFSESRRLGWTIPDKDL